MQIKISEAGFSGIAGMIHAKTTIVSEKLLQLPEVSQTLAGDRQEDMQAGELTFPQDEP
jgi:hypothetical protein